MPHEELPYWLYNVPKEQWPSECPDFLRDISERDRKLIGMWDSDFTRLTWSQVKELINSNRIDKFQRIPSDLRRYKGYTAKLTKDYGSVMNFVLKERLKWVDLAPEGAPFDEADDVKILYNDWPYGVDEKIVHLVVWTKFDLEDDPTTDDLTPEARKQIDDYVDKTFCTMVKPESVIWFKNWRSLKSIHAVEHFHVMLYDPDMAFVEEITNGDVPLAAKVGIMNQV